MNKLIRQALVVFKEHRVPLFIILTLIIVGSFLMLALPYFLKEMIDSIILGNYSRSYQMLGLMFVLWVLRSIILHFIRQSYEVRKVDYDIPLSLSQFSLGRFLGFSIGQHTNENSGVKQHVMQ